MVPLVTEGSARSASSVVPGRLPSSLLTVTSFMLVAAVSLSVTSIRVASGTISASSRPSVCAAAVRIWLTSAYSSCISRVIP